MPSIVNIRDPFLDCVQEQLVPVLKSMDTKYFVELLPILIRTYCQPLLYNRVLAFESCFVVQKCVRNQSLGTKLLRSSN